MGTVLWSPDYSSNGEIQVSRCRRFHIIEGTDHYTLLFDGCAVFRDKRDFFLKQLADSIMEEILKEEKDGRSCDNPQILR